MTEDNEIRIARSDDGLITTLLIDRPAKRNALSPHMMRALEANLKSAAEDDSRVVVLRSLVPGVFSAGNDINYLGGPEDEVGEETLQRCSQLLQHLRKVTVAAADGLVIGAGIVLFLACDLRLATHRSVFRMPPVRLARIYDFEGIARFVRVVGLSAATEMLLTARQYDAEEALRTGLVTRLLSETEALRYIEETAGYAPQAQQAMKTMLFLLGRDIARTELAPADADALGALVERARDSTDAREALLAFREKRHAIVRGA